MGDTISRQAAIDTLMEKDKKLRNINWYDKPYAEAECRGIDEALSIISNLPSAQPEQDREFMKLTVRNSNGRPYYSIIYLEFDDNGIGNDFEGYSSYSLDVISDYLKKYFMPSAKPEQRWIPCSERLPEKDGRYQVTRYDYVANTEFIDILWYEENLWWNRHSTGDYAVTAWMPLPEPYREDIE